MHRMVWGVAVAVLLTACSKDGSGSAKSGPRDLKREYLEALKKDRPDDYKDFDLYAAPEAPCGPVVTYMEIKNLRLGYRGEVCCDAATSKCTLRSKHGRVWALPGEGDPYDDLTVLSGSPDARSVLGYLADAMREERSRKKVAAMNLSKMRSPAPKHWDTYSADSIAVVMRHCMETMEQVAGTQLVPFCQCVTWNTANNFAENDISDRASEAAARTRGPVLRGVLSACLDEVSGSGGGTSK
jgi:hypothetical protein